MSHQGKEFATVTGEGCREGSEPEACRRARHPLTRTTEGRRVFRGDVNSTRRWSW